MLTVILSLEFNTNTSEKIVLHKESSMYHREANYEFF